VSEILEQRPDIIVTIYAQAGFLEKFRAPIGQSSISATEVTEEELRSISLQSTPNLVLAVCRHMEKTKQAQGSPFSFYLDDIRDPGNFGTIIRLCDWFGARSLFCSPSSCEFYNPKVIQASMGAFLRVNVSYGNLADVLTQHRPGPVYGAVLDGADLFEQKLASGLVVIGNEANGISHENMARITKPLTIPAHRQNGSESLNAAMATAIIAAEFFRQTRG
jgi:TrmH family RNA methyltransferase